MNDTIQELENNVRESIRDQAKLGLLSDLLLEALESKNIQVQDFVLKFNEKIVKNIQKENI